MIHTLDNNGKMQVNQSQPNLDLPPGSGPRHLEFHPNNKWIYVLNELNSTLSSVIYENNAFRIVNTISTLPDDFKDDNHAGAIRVHPSGKFLYSSNRSSDSISVFEIDDQGNVHMVQNFGTKLGWVRDFNISPSGKFIIAGNERSDEVILLKLDQSGMIDKYAASLELPNPSCFVFYSQN